MSVELGSLHPDIQTGVALQRKLGSLFAEIFEFLRTIDSGVKNQKYTAEELADLGYLCRRLELVGAETMLDAAARRRLAGKVLAVFVARRSIEDDSTSTSVNGNLGGAIVVARQAGRIPKKGTPDFVALLKGLGVSDEMIKYGALNPCWKGIEVLVTERMRANKPLPPGITQTFDNSRTSFRCIPNNGIIGRDDKEDDDDE